MNITDVNYFVIVNQIIIYVRNRWQNYTNTNTNTNKEKRYIGDL